MTRPSTTLPAADQDYAGWLATLKTHIRDVRLRAALSVNTELIALYWQIGREIVERQVRHGWGAKVVDQLSRDLRTAFPDSRGFSSANLRYMKAFAEAWPDGEICQQVVGRLPWGQNIELLRIRHPQTRRWYAAAALGNGWSRAVLAAQIDTRLDQRQGAALTNFERTLPPATSDLAQQVLKDPYQFDFLTLDGAVKERDLERALISRIRDLLLELGKGFTFVGSQHRLQVGEQDFYVDLLFYHRRLRCLIAVDLKMGPFQPEHAGKMNFYLAALDDRDREPGDAPSIGLILCRQHNQLVVEYSLRHVDAPIGVAQYRLLSGATLPDDVAAALPTVQELALGMVTPDTPDDA